MDWQVDAVALVRLSTVLIGIYILSLATIKYRENPPPSPTLITVVVVEDVQPRRALILTILTFAAFSYFLDCLIVIVYWLLHGWRQSDFVEWRGVELADSAGLVAYVAFIVIGINKDRKGVKFWTLKRVKFIVFVAIAFDIAYLVLMLITIPVFRKPASNPQIPELPNKLGIYLPNFFHFLALSVRLFLLVVLLIVLYRPATTYSTVHRQALTPTASTLLLPSQGLTTSPIQPEYGTFAEPSILPHGKSAEGVKSDDEGPAAVPDAYTHHHLGKNDSLVADPEPLDLEGATHHDESNAENNLLTSYAAVAAKALEKEKHADDEPSVPVAFPAGGSETPVGFPTRDDASSIRTGGVTFTPETNSTPLEGSEATDKKRKRISSQNLQKIVRRISLIPRRQGSISSLGSGGGSATNTPKKEGISFLRRSREDSRQSGEGSSYSGTVAETDVAEGGDPADQDGKGKSKPKKSKRKSLKI